MKKTYSSPEIYMERFDANEYIAACGEYVFITATFDCLGDGRTFRMTGQQYDSLTPGGGGVNTISILPGGEVDHGTGATLYIDANGDYVFAGTLPGHEGVNTTGCWGAPWDDSPENGICPTHTVPQNHHHTSTVSVQHDAS